MAQYGRNKQRGSEASALPPELVANSPAVAAPDSLIVEFLIAHGIQAVPPKHSSGATNALMGALTGVNPLIGGMMYVVKGQEVASAKSEWLSWKQWALGHVDWPAFWDQHRGRISAEVEQESRAKAQRIEAELQEYGASSSEELKKIKQHFQRLRSWSWLGWLIAGTFLLASLSGNVLMLVPAVLFAFLAALCKRALIRS